MSEPSSAQSMWDDRYRTEDFVYGTAPNAFLNEHINDIPKGDVLCLADVFG